MLDFNIPYFVTFLVYMVIVYMIGVVASRQTHSMSDYVLGGRSLSGPVAAMGAGASDMSGWLLMALPGAVFLLGFNQIWMPVGLIVGAALNWIFVAKRLRIYTEIAGDALTLPAYFAGRFEGPVRGLRALTAVVIMIFFTIYASAGFVAGALLTQAMFNFDYHIALLVSATVMIAYTCLGGFLAVSWVDFFQGTLVFVAVLIVPLVTIYDLGGFAQTQTLLANLDAHFFTLMPQNGLIALFSLLAWGLGYFGQPHILVRFMAVKTPAFVRQAGFICMTWMVLSLIGAILTGFVGAVFFKGQLDKPEMVFIHLSEALFNPWLAAVMISAVLSVIMSTIAAQLLAASSALSEDFYHYFCAKKASDHSLLKAGRLSVFAIALVSIGMSWNPSASLMSLVDFGWSGLGASFGPVVLLSLYYKKLSRKGVIAGLITGASVVLIWHSLGSSLGGIFKLSPIIPGFFLNGLMAVLVSTFEKTVPKQQLKNFEKMERLVKKA